MKRNKIIKPWIINLKAFFMFCLFCFTVLGVDAQNVIEKKLLAERIETITINGDQIFNISIVTAKTNYISISSKLDGEYQNSYQVATKQVKNELSLALEFRSFQDIPDDKRNAHKVIAATLYLQIPGGLELNINSDIGSVDLKGNYNMLSIELLQGHCHINGKSNYATVNTIDGNISIITQNAKVNASSNNGAVRKDNFKLIESIWNLRSINGDITIVKQE